MAFVSVTNRALLHLTKTNQNFVRHLNLMEYASKSLLRSGGVNVQRFTVLNKKNMDEDVTKSVVADEYVIKAQILAGGRGKGHFDTGFKSGVHFTTNPKDIKGIVEKMLGNRLITKQTLQTGSVVDEVMVAESVQIKRELYLCILMDRENNGPVVIASPMGGMDIEAVAQNNPEQLKVIPVDIYDGITAQLSEQVAKFLQFDPSLYKEVQNQLTNLWNLFKKTDCVQMEINPLVETTDKRVIAVDAKLGFDDNARFRQKDIFACDYTAEKDPREIAAEKLNINFIALDGDIGCLVNGAGLAMATMDIIKLHNGNPANFLDVGGAVQESQVQGALELLTADKNVKAILINVFGGIVNCATIANGIINACSKSHLNVPLVVRLQGTNVDEARRLLKGSKLNIISVDDFESAAEKVVEVTGGQVAHARA